MPDWLVARYHGDRAGRWAGCKRVKIAVELIGVEAEERVDAPDNLDFLRADVSIRSRDGQDKTPGQIAMRRR